MQKCIDSLLVGGEAVEIIIVNDGSTDSTAVIADGYAQKYPSIISVHHQPNKGHGGAINTGLAKAKAAYVKIVDSDDWVDAKAYKEILSAINSFSSNNLPDAIVSNYVYEKQGKRKKTVINYTSALPVGRIFAWDEVGRFGLGRYMLMHAIIYKRDILTKCSLVLPEHTFYVDNIYAFAPLAHVETMYYLDVDFYRYFIGREGQSVQEETMIKRIDQQLMVNKIMMKSVNLRTISSPPKRKYLLNYLEIVTAISSILLLKQNTSTSLMKKHKLWQFIKKQDAAVYKKLRKGGLGKILHPKTALGRQVAIAVYKASRKIVGFS